MFQYKRKKNKNNKYYYLKIDINDKKTIISKEEYYKNLKKGGNPNNNRSRVVPNNNNSNSCPNNVSRNNDNNKELNTYKLIKFILKPYGCPIEIKDIIAKNVICSGFTIHKINKKQKSNNSEKSTKILSYNGNYLEQSDKINNFLNKLINLFAIIQIYKMISSYNSGIFHVNAYTRKYNSYYKKNISEEEFIEIIKEGLLTPFNQLTRCGININGSANILNFEYLDKIYKKKVIKDENNEIIIDRRTTSQTILYDLIRVDYKNYIDFYNTNFNKDGFLKGCEIYEYMGYDDNKIKFTFVLKNPNGLIISLNEFIDVMKKNLDNGLDGVYYTNVNGTKYQSFYPFSGMTSYRINGIEKNYKYTYDSNNIHYNNNIKNYYYNNGYYTLGPLIKNFDDSYLYKYNQRILQK